MVLSAATVDPHLGWNLLDDVRQLFDFPFMVNAFRAGTVVAVVAGLVGWFMILRAQTFAGSVDAPDPWFELDTELAAAPFAGPDKALVVGRPGGPAFRPSELARLASTPVRISIASGSVSMTARGG